MRVPDGILVEDAGQELPSLNFPVAVKAQVQAGGRGRAGGVKFAQNREELQRHLKSMLGSSLGRDTVEKVLVEQKYTPLREFYVSVALDGTAASPVIAASGRGGVDVEDSGDVSSVVLPPNDELQRDDVERLTASLQVDHDIAEGIGEILRRAYEAFTESEALLVEINPLALLKDRTLVALDSKMTLDDCSSRAGRVAAKRGRPRSFEDEIREIGASGAELSGSVGVICSGAGCMLATVDQIASQGGTIRAAIDLSGTVFSGPSLRETLSACLKSVSRLQPRALVVNAFFQLAECNAFAEAFVGALEDSRFPRPVILRLKGNADGRVADIVKKAERVSYTASFGEACEMAVRAGAEHWP